MTNRHSGEVGCDYCRDDANLLYGHVGQLATSPHEDHAY
jgi:hypothetical protein